MEAQKNYIALRSLPHGDGTIKAGEPVPDKIAQGYIAGWLQKGWIEEVEAKSPTPTKTDRAVKTDDLKTRGT